MKTHFASVIKSVTPILVRTLRQDTGQSVKVRAILWSCWNGRHIVGLCDVLCGLDSNLANAVVAIIEARAFLGGDADELLRPILIESGEFDACKKAQNRAPEDQPFIYPRPLHSENELRELADAIS